MFAATPPPIAPVNIKYLSFKNRPKAPSTRPPVPSLLTCFRSNISCGANKVFCSGLGMDCLRVGIYKYLTRSLLLFPCRIGTSCPLASGYLEFVFSLLAAMRPRDSALRSVLSAALLEHMSQTGLK